MLTDSDLTAIWLTLKLAALVTVILLLLSLPLAWWLARTRSRWQAPVAAIVAMPLVLPPTVLGFYLLVGLSPNSPLGQALDAVGIGPLPFTFAGLVLASVIYSLPFVVQPLQAAMQVIDERPLEVAATLGAGPLDRFFTVVLPLCWRGIVIAAVLGFAHTLGEFGVVLMIGGNIEGETRVIAVQIYDHVEALNYGQAHRLSALMLVFSFSVLVLMYSLDRGRQR
ncbi:molybdate ABC transporter permease subunit [Bacterioplanes sanyensis]|uniref:Molybdenum transport system permease n=1 Tax=Bacterioplanes sanyensis TaxID=1249553 RepID=A0A222FP39_9GAMM|nr:molybdate ABC transporter permease subunit [Bacterioplanes sanyensis]ASP40778.1 molybdate ABC transporter permease subunit [Bacterioplanes sanyensis]